ncbi:hypothetical protein FMUND_8050 [Fusarium mundagurra]|uniref:Uncharacterized protein n=1 Tax=Fusarium mundagurra TaxID=1567541 RepID=A0A8H5YL06_9HYPO|nr:hypothetical protein FMUND_8050 [Fusarium mundagurra]
MPEAPAPHAPISFGRLLDDNEVVETRSNGSGISSAADLTVHEKISFHDLLTEWCNARPATARHNQVISSELRKSFFDRVFQLWDSRETQVSLPQLAPRTLKETSFEAGYLQDNLPITPRKRKLGDTAQRNEHRLANKPAYLSVEFSSESEGRDPPVWRDKGSTRLGRKENSGPRS